MSKTPNMLSAIEPWNLVAASYAETTMQMLAQYADEAIDTLENPDVFKQEM
jgi:hypothetical protein